jgi:hypothetical protein
MEMNKKLHITMCAEDVKDSIIKNLYYSQGISGIFDVKFKTKREFYKGIDPHDSDYRWVFDGAEIIIDLNER